MFGKRNKPSQAAQDDFAPADFSEDFGDSFGSPEMAPQDDAAAWGEPHEADVAQAQATVAPQKTSSSGFGKLLPVVAVAGLAVVGAGYFFLLPLGKTSAPVVAEVKEISPVGEGAEPILTLPETPARDTTQTSSTPLATTPTGTTQPESAVLMPDGQAELASSVASSPATEPVPQNVMAPTHAPMATDMAVSPSIDETPLASASDSSASLPFAPATAASTAASTPMSVLPTRPEPSPAPVPTSSIVLQKPQVEVAAAPMPSMPALSSQSPSAPVLTSPSAAVPVPAGTVATTSDAGADISALSARLTVLERQIDDLTKAVDKMAAATTIPDSVARLSKTVDSLSKQVAAIKVAPRSASITSESRSLEVPAQAGLTSEPVTAAPVLSATSASPVMSQPAPRVETQSRVSTPAKSVAWVLRAAQSGVAWVSPSKEGDLQRVAVGESLAGVGRIQSIEIKDGAWEITGTKGKIRQ